MMKSQLLNQKVLPDDVLRLLTHFAPSSIPDALALATFSFALSAYISRGYAWDKPNPHRHLWFERPQASDGEGSSGKATTRNIAEKAQELV